jgi:shikimate dehydrogenase
LNIDTETLLCAVIGNPVGHSLSPAIHNAAFEAIRANGVYLAFCVSDVSACLQGMRAFPNFRGLSVTIPHKEAVMPCLDDIDPLARHVGCVNTITHRNGRLTGTSTDGLGTLRAFEEAGVDLTGRRILFTGAGGAVRSVAFAMAERARPAKITLLGRSVERLSALVQDLRAGTPTTIEAGTLSSDVEKAVREHDVIVQGTPVGMHGHDEGRSCIPPESLRAEQVVFDMVYRPLKTRLIEDAEATGCTTIWGAEMLVNQAALQFEAWMEMDAPRAVMREALLAALGGPANLRGENGEKERT